MLHPAQEPSSLQFKDFCSLAQPDALFVIVPALALPTKLAAVAYIVTFVVGTVTAMGGYAALIGARTFVLCGNSMA